MKNIIIIAGPTGVGKSAAAIELAKKIDGEIISADSMQIYKGMDIGTAKVTKAEMSGIVHYLIDVVEPSENFSVSDFDKLATEKIMDIFSRNKTPIVVGGTGLYINSLIYKMDYHEAPVDEILRNSLWEFYNQEGKDKLYEKLIELDQNTQVEKSNIKRVIRAIEILSTNKPQNSFVGLKNREDFACCLNVLQRDRKQLYKIIDNRVDLMLEQGLLEEVKALIYKGLTNEHQSIKAIGYRQFYDYFKGEVLLEEAIETVKKDSRRYAKRQLTWFRRYKDVNWIDVDGLSVDEILTKIEIDKK